MCLRGRLLLNLTFIFKTIKKFFSNSYKWKNSPSRGNGDAYRPTQFEHYANIITHAVSRVNNY